MQPQGFILNQMKLFWTLFTLLALFHSAISVSLDTDSLWHIFNRLNYKDMKSFVKAHPYLLRDHNVRTLLKCRGNYVCAISQRPNPLLFKAIPHRLHKQYIRQFAMKNEEKIVREMIKNDFDPKWLDYPLKRALRLGLDDEAEWIRSLLPRSMKTIGVVQVDPEINSNELLQACRSGQLEQVQELIRSGVDVNGKDSLGETALWIALHKRRVDIIKLLIDAGADLNPKNKWGWPALMWAAYNGHFEIVKFLIEAGADVNTKCNNGHTTLIIASESGDTEMVKALIEAGADLNAKNSNGDTALIRALILEQTEVIVKVLIDAGADVNAKGRSGRTALMVAARKERLETVKALLASGADVHANDEDGKTALEYSERSSEVRKELKRVVAKSEVSQPNIWRRFKGNKQIH